MRSLTVLILLLMSARLKAQHFVESQTIKLDKTIASTILESADFNNNGLLDVIMFNADLNGIHQIQFIKNDSTAGFILQPEAKNILINPFSGYSIVDYDNDNDIDIVLFSATTSIYSNEGDFVFVKSETNLPPFSIAKWVDLDNNGSREIVGSFIQAGESVTGIFRQKPDGTWRQTGDTFALTLKSLEVLDPDADGYKDLFISGSRTDSLFTGFLINDRELRFKPVLGKSWVGSTAAGDLNEDGFFDIVFIGLDSLSGLTRKILLSKNETYVVRDTTLAASEASLFISDFNADGIADISSLGKNSDSDTVHAILFADGSAETTIISNLKSQQFLDFNRDGNLDIVRATQPDSIHVTFYANQSAANEGPEAPEFAMSNKIFDRYFFFWVPSIDDRTNSKSLTYDFLLQGDETIQSAEFDFSHERRLLTSHGNALTQTFKFFNALPSDPSGFGIQAVDNSFQAVFLPGSTGLCMGVTANSCSLESQAVILEVCPFEPVTLPSPPASYWFSFKDGYLGSYDDFNYTSTRTDTLFYYDPAVFDCSALKTFVIKVRNTTSVEHFTEYVCENETLSLEAEDNWQAVQWRSMVRGELGQTYTLQYKVSVNDSIFAQLTGNGCDVLRKTAIIISKPEVTIEHDQLAILKGNAVQLQAFGAERYAWSPATYLSDPTLPNPMASPDRTTVYTVTGYDSINCTAAETVTITVESAGFIPNLFSPNDDGTNDQLLVYGLREAQSFSFTIVNREGKVVYETRSPSEISSAGWDGRKNGQRQPVGVYFWKVKGRHPSGEAVKLNGESEGSIILVR